MFDVVKHVVPSTQSVNYFDPPSPPPITKFPIGDGDDRDIVLPRFRDAGETDSVFVLALFWIRPGIMDVHVDPVVL